MSADYYRCYLGGISADGQRVAFSSRAYNLVTGDTNDCTDVFVKDLSTGTTVRASTFPNGAQAKDHSFQASLSADGRYVAFRSRATELADYIHYGSNTSGVFRKDLVTGAVSSLSSTAGGLTIPLSDQQVSLSGDGRYAAFMSDSPYLIAEAYLPGSYYWNVFRKDAQTQALSLVSQHHPTMAPVTAAFGGGGGRVSQDGRYVLFGSGSTNLTPGLDLFVGWGQVFVRDMLSGTTTLVSANAAGEQANLYNSFPGAISANGRYVVFCSSAPNLVPNDINNDNPDVFVKDLQTGTITLITTDSQGNQSKYHSLYYQEIMDMSDDGRFVVFDHAAVDLVPGDTNNKADVFLKDLQTGTTTRVSTASDGSQANQHSYSPHISGNGRYVAFDSSATNLIPGDPYNHGGLFVKDLVTGVVVRASTNANGYLAQGAAELQSISDDGRYVAFLSADANLVPGDTNGKKDLFVKDLWTGALVRANTDASGGQANQDA